MKLNPIVKKDVKVSSRSFRLSFSVLGYSIANLILFILMLMSFSMILSNGSVNIHRLLFYVFPILAIIQTIIIVFIMPIMTSSSISGERERQTFDIMMTTCMSPFSIVIGKLLSALATILLFFVSCIPIMSFSFMMGGAKWSSLITFCINILLLSVLSGSIGIFCSSVCRKTITSTILSYIIFFFFYIVSFVPLVICSFFAIILSAILDMETLGEILIQFSIFFLLGNPLVYMEEFFSKLMFGTSIFTGDTMETLCDFNTLLDYPLKFLSINFVWPTISAVIIIVASFVFLLLATWIIDPMHGRKK